MTTANKAGSAERMTIHILAGSTCRRARMTKRALIRSPNQTRQGIGLPVSLSDFTENFFGLFDVPGDLIREFLDGFKGLFISQPFDEKHFDRFAQKIA